MRRRSSSLIISNRRTTRCTPLTVRATFVRAEPLVVPKRSLTNSASERVDVRVLQIIYALPTGAANFVVGQQVDGFVPARSAAQRRPAP